MNDDERQKLLEQMEADEKAMRAFEDAVIKMALYASEIAPLFQKPLIDALMHAGAFADDEQIDRLLTQRHGVEKGGRCEVTIQGYGELWRKHV